jgi:hypothetical protein
VATQLSHTDVQRMMASFAEGKIVNLDVPVRQLVESAQRGLPTGGEDLSLHVLCCNEYFLVTGIVAAPIDEVRAAAGEVRGALG